VIWQYGCADEARWARDCGVDVVIAQRLDQAAMCPAPSRR
jgi:hypothetical protein